MTLPFRVSSPRSYTWPLGPPLASSRSCLRARRFVDEVLVRTRWRPNPPAPSAADVIAGIRMRRRGRLTGVATGEPGGSVMVGGDYVAFQISSGAQNGVVGIPTPTTCSRRHRRPGRAYRTGVLGDASSRTVTEEHAAPTRPQSGPPAPRRRRLGPDGEIVRHERDVRAPSWSESRGHGRRCHRGRRSAHEWSTTRRSATFRTAPDHRSGGGLPLTPPRPAGRADALQQELVVEEGRHHRALCVCDGPAVDRGVAWTTTWSRAAHPIADNGVSSVAENRPRRRRGPAAAIARWTPLTGRVSRKVLPPRRRGKLSRARACRERRRPCRPSAGAAQRTTPERFLRERG